MVRGVATHLMFTGDASAALELYAAVFAEFRVAHVEHYGVGEAGAPGSVRRADVVFGQHRIIVIDSPVKHDTAFAQLAQGGQIFMPIANYGFSQRFGWCSDRFGVSWQLNLP